MFKIKYECYNFVTILFLYVKMAFVFLITLLYLFYLFFLLIHLFFYYFWQFRLANLHYFKSNFIFISLKVCFSLCFGTLYFRIHLSSTWIDSHSFMYSNSYFFYLYRILLSKFILNFLFVKISISNFYIFYIYDYHFYPISRQKEL